MLPEHTVSPAPNTITQLQPPSHLSDQATSSHHKVLKTLRCPSEPCQLLFNRQIQTCFCTIKGKWTRVRECWTNLQDVNTSEAAVCALYIFHPEGGDAFFLLRMTVWRHDRTSVSCAAPPNVVRMHYLWSSITETDYGAKWNLAPVTRHKYFKKIIQMYIFL